LTLCGIGFLAVVLMTASALNIDLGAPAFAAGMIVAAAVSFRDRATPGDVAKEISWSVLPLVAGLFVIVEAVSSAGALAIAAHVLALMKHCPTVQAITVSSFGIGFLSNLMNNLPAGLISGAAVNAAGAV